MLRLYRRPTTEITRAIGAVDAAKAVVLQLVDELGFDGVDAASRDESWRQQPGTPVYATDFDVDSVRRALAEASRERCEIASDHLRDEGFGDFSGMG